MSPATSTPVVSLREVSKVYGAGDVAVAALRSVELTVEPGEYVAIMGASGSGKSTMMNIIGCLDEPTSGTYELQGHDVSGLDGDTLSLVRSRLIGFIFQSFHLVSDLKVVDNVEIPLLYRKMSHRERRRMALAALDLSLIHI